MATNFLRETKQRHAKKLQALVTVFHVIKTIEFNRCLANSDEFVCQRCQNSIDFEKKSEQTNQIHCIPHTKALKSTSIKIFWFFPLNFPFMGFDIWFSLLNSLILARQCLLNVIFMRRIVSSYTLKVKKSIRLNLTFNGFVQQSMQLKQTKTINKLMKTVRDHNNVYVIWYKTINL